MSDDLENMTTRKIGKIVQGEIVGCGMKKRAWAASMDNAKPIIGEMAKWGFSVRLEIPWYPGAHRDVTFIGENDDLWERGVGKGSAASLARAVCIAAIRARRTMRAKISLEAIA
jgi:hypothetical protein